MSTLRVGIVGANVQHGWAFRAHVPAIEALQRSGTLDIAVTAVATSRTSSAEEAARSTGAQPFTSAAALAASTDVDLVAVTVKVPAHRALVTAAGSAGKAVLSEWPLGLDLVEARELDAGTTSSAAGFVGLQARHDPAAAALRDYIASGELGDLQAVSARSSRAKFVGDIPEPYAYTLDRASGAGTREVHTGHLLDLVHWITGGIEVIGGATAVQRSGYRITGRDEPLVATAPDTVTAQFAVGGGLGTAMIWDGNGDAETVVHLEGSRGRATLRTLPVGTPLTRQVQMAPLRAEVLPHGSSAATVLDVADPLAGLQLPVESRNVAAQYVAIAADLLDGGHRAATFTDAVRVHRWIEMLAEDLMPGDRVVLGS